MAAFPKSENLRILSIDGGGIKGYTALLILRRIFRCLTSEGGLAVQPRPCEVFDYIAGTSTGGLIAVMLGRLHMTIDECISAYEEVGKVVFGKGPMGGQMGKLTKGVLNSPFYNIEVLQNEIQKILEKKGFPKGQSFLEKEFKCKVMLCVTRKSTSRADVLRNYDSEYPTEENYDCAIWEAASATAAAPMYFKHVKFEKSGLKWCDGGMRRNNPINEILAEVNREHRNNSRDIGCIISLGTGTPHLKEISANLASFLVRSVEMMTDAEEIANQYAASKEGRDLAKSNKYFRFSVPYGMSEIRLEDYKEIEKMNGLTTEYLRSVASGDLLESCAKSLLRTQIDSSVRSEPRPSILPYSPSTHFVERSYYAKRLYECFQANSDRAKIFVLHGFGGTGKTQMALKFAHDMKHRLSIFWIRGDSFANFATDFEGILPILNPTGTQTPTLQTQDRTSTLSYIRQRLEDAADDWLLVLDNADSFEQFKSSPDQEVAVARFLPRRGRILITTRDSHFVGNVSKVQDAEKCVRMSPEEGKMLLLSSIPSHQIVETDDATVRARDELLQELGCLPLAIAQAAANIRDRGIGIKEYVTLFKNKARRMELMEKPAWDLQDPSGDSRSIYITWEVSFEYLESKCPLAASYLSCLGFFSFQEIPESLVNRLSIFQDKKEEDLQQARKYLLKLALVDWNCSLDSPNYAMHPLVHEQVVHRLPEQKTIQYLVSCSEMLCDYFPSLDLRSFYKSKKKKMIMTNSLFPHAARQIALAEAVEFQSPAIARLLQICAIYLEKVGLCIHGVGLATKAVAMSSLVCGEDSIEVLVAKKTLCYLLNTAAMYAEAEESCRHALEHARNIVVALQDNGKVEESILDIFYTLLIVLYNQYKWSEVTSTSERLLTQSYKRLKLDRQCNIKMIAKRAYQELGQGKKANDLLLEVFNLVITKEHPETIPKRVRLDVIIEHLIHLFYTHGGSSGDYKEVQEDTLGKVSLIYHQVCEEYGSGNLLMSKDLGELIRTQLLYGRIDEARMELQIFLHGMCQNAGSVEGVNLHGFEFTYGLGRALIWYLYRYDEQEEAEKLKVSLDDCISVCKVELQGSWRNAEVSALRFLGYMSRARGQFAKAETCYRKALELYYEGTNESAFSMASWNGINEQDCLYNIMLSIGLQGRIDDAEAFREAHIEKITAEEAERATLKRYLDWEELVHRNYGEAQERLRLGTLVRGDEWWSKNGKALWCGELRYGILDPDTKDTSPNTEAQASATREHKDWSQRWLPKVLNLAYRPS